MADESNCSKSNFFFPQVGKDKLLVSEKYNERGNFNG